MKRLLGLILVLAVLVGWMPATADASSTVDMMAMARFFPVDTPVYAALGTSEADFAALETLLGVLSSAAPDEFPSNVSVSALLNLASLSITGGNYADSIGSWLGEAAAFGLFDLEAAMTSDLPPFAFAFSVTDPAALSSFMDDLAVVAFEDSEQPYAISKAGAYTRYDVPAEDAVFLAGQDVLYLGTPSGIDAVLALGSQSLARHPRFVRAMSTLPAPGYTLALYLDLPRFAPVFEEEEALPPNLAPDDLPAVAMGLGLLDGRALVLDTAQLASPIIVRQELPELPAVSVDFAANIPVDALLTVLGRDVTAMQVWIDQAIRASIWQGAMESDFSFELGDFETEDPAEALAEMERAVQEMRDELLEATGLDLDEDVLGWMTGSYAAFMTVDSEALAAGLPDEMPYGFGLAVQVTDPAAVDKLMDGLETGLENQDETDLTVSQETIGGSPVFVLEDVEADEGTFDLVVGGRENAFLVATRSEAEDALTMTGGGLAASAYFQDAAAYVVPDASLVMFLNWQAAAPIMLADASPEEAADTALALSLMDSLTFSAAVQPNGAGVSRLVIMLPQK